MSIFVIIYSSDDKSKADVKSCSKGGQMIQKYMDVAGIGNRQEKGVSKPILSNNLPIKLDFCSLLKFG